MLRELSILDQVAHRTLEYANQIGVPGAVVVGIARIQDGLFVSDSKELATKLVRTELRDEQDKGSDYGAVAYAKMLRRLRNELGIDTTNIIRRGEIDFRGDTAFVINGIAYVVCFSGDPTQVVDNKIAMDGALDFWLTLSKSNEQPVGTDA